MWRMFDLQILWREIITTYVYLCVCAIRIRVCVCVLHIINLYNLKKIYFPLVLFALVCIHIFICDNFSYMPGIKSIHFAKLTASFFY